MACKCKGTRASKTVCSKSHVNISLSFQVDYGDLMQALVESSQEMGLQAVDSFTAKCIQLYETTLVRHGLMLVGPTMGGKTACYRALQKVVVTHIFSLHSWLLPIVGICSDLQQKCGCVLSSGRNPLL